MNNKNFLTINIYIFILFFLFSYYGHCCKEPLVPYDSTNFRQRNGKAIVDYKLIFPSGPVNSTVPNFKHISIRERRFDGLVTGNFIILHNPIGHFSIIPPSFGCQNYERTSITSVEGVKLPCVVSLNGGFFNLTTPSCIGNVISNGTHIQITDSLNSNFGITKDNRILIGYLDQKEILKLGVTQLQSGVLWIVRDGNIWVNESFSIEKPLPSFVTLLAPRVGYGITRQGEIIFIQVDGYLRGEEFGNQPGLNLYQFAELALEYGAVELVNMDGGGSATVLINGVFKSQCTDSCQIFDVPRQCPTGPIGRCERKVSTIACIN